MRAFVMLQLLFYSIIGKLWTDTHCPLTIKQIIWNGGAGGNSDLQNIYKTLTRCSNDENTATRTLHLNIQQAGCVVNVNDAWSFNFRPGDKFPPLHELHLDGYDFNDHVPEWKQDIWDLWYFARQRIAQIEIPGMKLFRPTPRISSPVNYGGNLKKWKAAMNWTELRDLELENVDPIFFHLMEGQLPALKTLRLGRLWSGPGHVWNVTDFATQLDPLARLSLHGHTSQLNLTQILNRHGSTLEALEIREWEGDHFLRPTLSLSQLEQINQKASVLSKLGLDINRNGSWPFELLDSLAANENISSLTIFFELGMNMHLPPHDYYSLHEHPNKSTDFGEPLVNSASSLFIFERLRSRKKGVELRELRLEVGDFGRHYSHVLRFPAWGESLAEAYGCSVLDSKGERKAEGVDWCGQISFPNDLDEKRQ